MNIYQGQYPFQEQSLQKFAILAKLLNNHGIKTKL
jgi:hypothetical protein